jgi:hypothetical protein
MRGSQISARRSSQSLASVIEMARSWKAESGRHQAKRVMVSNEKKDLKRWKSQRIRTGIKAW